MKHQLTGDQFRTQARRAPFIADDKGGMDGERRVSTPIGRLKLALPDRTQIINEIK